MILADIDMSGPGFLFFNLACAAVAILFFAFFCDFANDWRKEFIDLFNATVPIPSNKKSKTKRSNTMVTLQVIGHLGKDAIMNNVNGKTVINFSVAHSEKHKNAQGVEVNHTLWVDCSFWTDRTKIAEYLKQGTLVYVTGKPGVETYKNNQGVTVAKQRLRVNDIQLLSAKKDGETTTPAEASQPTANSEDDLPF